LIHSSLYFKDKWLIQSNLGYNHSWRFILPFQVLVKAQQQQEQAWMETAGLGAAMDELG